MKTLLFFLLALVNLSFSSGFKTINYDTIKVVLIKTLGNFSYFETDGCEKDFEPFIVKVNELVLKFNNDQGDLPENTIASETKALCSLLVEPVDNILIANNIDINFEGDRDDETSNKYYQVYQQAYLKLYLPLSQCWVEE